jgi:multiple sugar transport system permease protein
MAITTISAPDGAIVVPKPKWRPLESEGSLALLLLLPTVALLLMFIAYPFVRGILLAVTNSKVGQVGDFVGFENFARLLKDPIFHAVVYNTFLYTFAISRSRHSRAPSSCCRSSCRPCWRASPGNGCSIRRSRY